MFFKPLKYILIEIAAIMLLVILCTTAILVSAALLNSWLGASSNTPVIQQIQCEESDGNNVRPQ